MVQTLIKHLDQCINVNVMAEIKKSLLAKIELLKQSWNMHGIKIFECYNHVKKIWEKLCKLGKSCNLSETLKECTMSSSTTIASNNCWLRDLRLRILGN